MTLFPALPFLETYIQRYMYDLECFTLHILIKMPRTTLSPLDLSMPSSYAHETLFFQTSSTNYVDTLKRALEATCIVIPTINGSLCPGEHGRAPVIFHRQYSVNKLIKVYDFAAHVGYEELKDACIHPARSRSPALEKAVQVLAERPWDTLQSKGGAQVVHITIAKVRRGFAMTLHFQHLVFDITSIGVFLRVLAAHCSGEEKGMEVSPQAISRDILSNVPSKDYEYHLAALNEAIKPSTGPQIQDSDLVGIEQAKRASVTSENFHFSAAALKDLKADVTAALDHTTETKWISSHDALFSLFWSCIITASSEHSSLNDEDKSTICMAVSLGRRLDPPLPEDYLGTAVCAPGLSAPIQLLRTATTSYASLAQISQVIRAKVNSVDAEYVRRCFDTSTPANEDEIDPPAFVPRGDIDFSINSWAEQGVCELNWGPDVGSCELVTRVYSRSPCVYVMPRLPNNGGLYVYTALDAETMKELQQNELFAKYATW